MQIVEVHTLEIHAPTKERSKGVLMFGPFTLGDVHTLPLSAFDS